MLGNGGATIKKATVKTDGEENKKFVLSIVGRVCIYVHVDFATCTSK